MSLLHNSNKHEGFPMKKMFFAALATTAAMTALAAPAAAQTPQTIEIIGNAEAFCSLPDTYAFVSGFNGGNGGQFNTRTWTIPPQLVADTSGQAIGMNEVAIRVRGNATCNTGHNIELRSLNGGLASDEVSEEDAPPGFTRKLRMRYSAHWLGQPTWGVNNWEPNAAGASTTYEHGNRVPPGSTQFDIRMGLIRESTTSPMLAGEYSDTLTVIISVAS